ncbi:MAG TPA: hypothetical protein VK653_12355 [Xanthobacteraceae bacterium]|jgi:hypothetical protein|nr:hypothetical protein [Xanthobacteraceae bacterium]
MSGGKRGNHTSCSIASGSFHSLDRTKSDWAASVLTSPALFDFSTTISATPVADSEEGINFTDPIIFTVINGEWPVLAHRVG